MKNLLLGKCSAIIIVVLFGGSIVSSYDSNTVDYNDESVESILSFGGFSRTAYIFEVYPSFGLIEITCQGWNSLGPGPGLLSGGTWIPDDDYPWWVVEVNNSGSPIWKINTDGDYVQVTDNCGASLNGLEFDPVTEQLFGCSSDVLYNINMNTGEATVVGSLNSGSLFIMMAISNLGQGYGIDLVTDSLYKINLSDASIELVGSTGQSMNYAQDCSFDHDADPEVLYVAAYTTGGALFICDINTGLFTLVGSFQGGAEMTAFAISYGIEYENQDPYAEFLYTPLGPYNNQTVLFDASASYDTDGNITSYYWDWDNDGNYDSYSTNPVINHSWSNAGEITIKLKVRDDLCGWATKSHTITIFENNPPITPEINGPKKGLTGVKYTYFISPVLDPDGDDVYVYWEWGDGLSSGWIGPYKNGEEIYKYHIWSKKGNYLIKAKLKDYNSAESNWGTFELSIPKTRAIYDFNWLILIEKFPLIEVVFSHLIKR